VKEIFMNNPSGSLHTTLRRGFFALCGNETASSTQWHGLLVTLCSVDAMKAALKITSDAGIQPNEKQQQKFKILPTAKLCDVDTLLEQVIALYHQECERERQRLVEVLTQYDVDQSGDISLQEFKAFVRHLEPTKFNDRELVQMFNELVGWTQDDEALTQDTIINFCLHMGLYSPKITGQSLLDNTGKDQNRLLQEIDSMKLLFGDKISASCTKRPNSVLEVVVHKWDSFIALEPGMHMSFSEIRDIHQGMEATVVDYIRQLSSAGE
jgi:hypothetical protein